ncbi:Putative methionine and alanine importer, small subunit [Tessaracoccus bendigoensis DSM 12906]|uniref:Putative methionine and alanine importer, small subunit n=1 Tax=Tessaracoccus bendigoensis DSM 12906 TaxID=1123357 RepID=A0A1M6E418_9ACTN|nr:methionine/alanine import family NSS transporter small subunit [Tessaracoccus bendigoensis]SHI80236.1 Putative methionine and alanine importer, small subunit [Tessaracoccus bendigoensis DSM 12906]
MTSIAITMLVISLLTVWGGLGLAAWNLFRRPDRSAEEDTAPE